MTTKKELLAKIAELQAQVDEMPDEFKIPTARAYEALEKGQKHSYVTARGDVTETFWDNLSSGDRKALKAGQIFLSAEAAEREAKRRELWHQCRKAMKEAWEAFGEMPDWTNERQGKYCVELFENRLCDRIYTETYQGNAFPTEQSYKAWRSTVTDEEIRLMLIDEW